MMARTKPLFSCFLILFLYRIRCHNLGRLSWGLGKQGKRWSFSPIGLVFTLGLFIFGFLQPLDEEEELGSDAAHDLLHHEAASQVSNLGPGPMMGNEKTLDIGLIAILHVH